MKTRKRRKEKEIEREIKNTHTHNIDDERMKTTKNNTTHKHRRTHTHSIRNTVTNGKHIVCLSIANGRVLREFASKQREKERKKNNIGITFIFGI